MNGTRVIKISTATGEFFFSVMAQDQAEWMARILWAKMAAMGKQCPLNDIFQGAIDGEILKRGFFGNW
jgi:hypothetical protein